MKEIVSNKVKNRKRIIIILAVIFLLLIFLIVLGRKNRPVDEKSSIKEIVEYLGSTYYGDEISSEEGYKRDIYISYSSDPVTSDGNWMKYVYDNMAVALSKKMPGKNFRVIDKKRDIIQRVYYEEDGTYTYIINNDENFFKEKYNNIIGYSENKYLDKINIDVLSKEVNYLIQSNWNEKNAKNMGTVESKDREYIHYKEGYSIRYFNGKVFNIVFTKNYKDDVVKLTNIEKKKESILNTNKLRKEHDYLNIDKDIESNADFEATQPGGKIGWKGDKIYVFCKGEEISIYPVNVYENIDNSKFLELVKNIEEDGDLKKFVDKTTDIYSDFTEYKSEDDSIEISFPIRGIKIRYGKTGANGVFLYNNYYDTNKYTKEYFQNNPNEFKQILLNMNEDLINEYESKRTIITEEKNKEQE